MNEEQLQQIQALVEAALKGDEQANQQIQAVMQAAQQGNPQAQQIAAIIQQVAEELQSQSGAQTTMNQAQPTTMARHGAKLNYINYLRGKCPEGYEIGYFKRGGNICKACVKKKQKMQEGASIPEPTDAIEAFKCGRKTKKPKCETGAPIEMDKCGGQAKKVKKADDGTDLELIKQRGQISNKPGYHAVPVDGYKEPGGIWIEEETKEPSSWYMQPLINGMLITDNSRVGLPNDTVKYIVDPRFIGLPRQPRIVKGQKNKPTKKANGGSFVPFMNRVLR